MRGGTYRGVVTRVKPRTTEEVRAKRRSRRRRTRGCFIMVVVMMGVGYYLLVGVLAV